MTFPMTDVLVTDVIACVGTADALGVFKPAPFAGDVTSVSFIGMAAITGANTESRTFNLYNRTRSKTIATLAMVSGVNSSDNVAKAVTISSTADDYAVNEGDVLEFESLHVGSTGLNAPQLKAIVTLTRD